VKTSILYSGKQLKQRTLGNEKPINEPREECARKFYAEISAI
jgi:hypothetical protein